MFNSINAGSLKRTSSFTFPVIFEFSYKAAPQNIRKYSKDCNPIGKNLLLKILV